MARRAILSYLPSKKFTLILAAVLVISAGLFFGIRKEKSEGNGDQKQEEGKNNYSFFQNSQNDSDNDGLKDWEEALWKTDPKNPDTDGDGIPDSQETRESASGSTGLSSAGGSSETQGLTKTETMAQNLILSLYLLKQSGNLNDETKQELVESLVAQASQEKLSDKYMLSDLVIIYQNNSESLKKYGNRAAEIMDIHSAGLKENEIEVFKKITENGSSNTNELNKYTEAYEKIISDLLKTETPDTVANLNLRLINNFYKVKESVENMKMFFDDPLRAFVGLNQYMEESQSIFQTIKDMNDFFASKGVVFTSSEYGYYFKEITNP